jgi:hypothetical protein
MADEPIPLAELINGGDAKALATAIPGVVRVICPISTGTVDEAVRQAGMSTQDAIDAALVPVRATIETNRRRARLAALILGRS